MAVFAGLTQQVFDAYAQEKWASNVYNLPRMRGKDLMLALCDAVQSHLREELEGLDRAASDEVPNISNHKRVDAQWVYWFRDKAARDALASFLEKTPLDQAIIFNIAPQDKHATLAVVLRQHEVWIGLRVAAGAAVDRRNLAVAMGKQWQRENFVALLGDIPEGATSGMEGALVPAHEESVASLERLVHDLGDKERAWQLGHAITAEDAIGLGVELADHIARWLGALAPVYRYVAWTRDNDHIDVTRQLHEEKIQKRKQASGYNVGDKVRIVSGLFSGKTGIVQDIDSRAQVRVRVGKMSVVVPGTDLTPAA
ncbi:MAG: hypothetical protein AAB426_00500 [Myxococcota bacterium]